MAFVAKQQGSEQLGTVIPLWLSELVNEQARTLRGDKAGWKGPLVIAALVEFLQLPDDEQREKVLRMTDPVQRDQQGELLRRLLDKRRGHKSK